MGETRIDPGTRSPIRKGTLYDINCHGRLVYHDAEGGISPGPARYNHKDGFDSKGLLEKMMNVPVPPRQHRRTSMPRPFELEEGEEVWDPTQPDSDSEAGQRTSKKNKKGKK